MCAGSIEYRGGKGSCPGGEGIAARKCSIVLSSMSYRSQHASYQTNGVAHPGNLVVIVAIVEDQPLKHLDAALNSRPSETGQPPSIRIPEVVFELKPGQEGYIVVCSSAGLSGRNPPLTAWRIRRTGSRTTFSFGAVAVLELLSRIAVLTPATEQPSCCCESRPHYVVGAKDAILCANGSHRSEQA